MISNEELMVMISDCQLKQRGFFFKVILSKDSKIYVFARTIEAIFLDKVSFYWSCKKVGTYPALLSDELGAENLAVTYPLSQVIIL